MIRYALRCKAGHGFEGWFRGLEDFETQKATGLLACPACGSGEVDKALMAPAVSTARSKEARAEKAAASVRQAGAAEAAEPAQMPAIAAPRTPEQAALMEKLRALRAELTANAEDVGTAFPEEARKIHYGEAEARGIYGAASREDVGELLEEGIAVMPLPVLPEDRN
ncbi:DUF1178 family protein [Stappia indica]|uniref:DUF1178 family protein n=1 Tax=Stappia indica TaxID=538381 RepID=UPI001D193986|nr:DUF1178 family protein [Stappia indica]MCC4244413.1 DUF1178 family protein [Stappia indica]